MKLQRGFVLVRCHFKYVFCWSPFSFFLEEKHGRFIRQSITYLSSISNECDDSFLLLLSKLLTTIVAFFPTRDELNLLCKSLKKLSAIALRGPSTECDSGPYSSTRHRRSNKDVAVMSHQCRGCFCGQGEHVVAPYNIEWNSCSVATTKKSSLSMVL
jgi:hypothetical protein